MRGKFIPLTLVAGLVYLCGYSLYACPYWGLKPLFAFPGVAAAWLFVVMWRHEEDED